VLGGGAVGPHATGALLEQPVAVGGRRGWSCRCDGLRWNLGLRRNLRLRRNFELRHNLGLHRNLELRRNFELRRGVWPGRNLGLPERPPIAPISL
jgi:hypothetical protein